jgi:hypothetical protein
MDSMMAMDACTCEGLALDVALSTSAARVMSVLTARIAQHGAPGYLRRDNGAEFVATARYLMLHGPKPGVISSKPLTRPHQRYSI